MERSVKKGKRPVKLGITGGIGSGKSFVSACLQSKGVCVVSADELARKAVMPGTAAYRQIVDYFGDRILSADKTLNRQKLRGIITRDKEKKEKLEQFVHPEVFLQMDQAFQEAEKRHDPVIAYEIPLLFETGMEGYFDYVLTVSVDRGIRIRRLMERDRISKEEARALIAIQMPEEKKIEKSDFVIDNNGSVDRTRDRIDRFYQNFIRMLKND